MKDFSHEPQIIQWNRLEVELQCLEKDIKIEMVLELYKQVLIDNPRLALFRAFSLKCKDEAKNFEIEEKVEAGNYYLKQLDPECIYEMHLSY